MQVTSKGSDQTAHMRRLVWAFAGRTYHIVENLMPWLKCSLWFIALMKTVHTLHESRLVDNWITMQTVTYIPSMQISFNTSI